MTASKSGHFNDITTSCHATVATGQSYVLIYTKQITSKACFLKGLWTQYFLQMPLKLQYVGSYQLKHAQGVIM